MDYTYICSRLKPDADHSIGFHMNVAAAACRAFSKENNYKSVPIAPHIYFPIFLEDDNQEERDFSLQAGKQLLGMCSQMKVIVVDGIISEGMQGEISMAEGCMPVQYAYFTKEEMEKIIQKILL